MLLYALFHNDNCFRCFQALENHTTSHNTIFPQLMLRSEFKLGQEIALSAASGNKQTAVSRL